MLIQIVVSCQWLARNVSLILYEVTILIPAKARWSLNLISRELNLKTFWGPHRYVVLDKWSFWRNKAMDNLGRENRERSNTNLYTFALAVSPFQGRMTLFFVQVHHIHRPSPSTSRYQCSSFLLGKVEVGRMFLRTVPRVPHVDLLGTQYDVRRRSEGGFNMY